MTRHDWRLRHLDEIDSTNRFVLAETGEGPGLVVTASHQTAGRGRLDRQWIDEGNCLMVSLRLEPHLASVAVRAAGLAVLRACRACSSESFTLKWPNDVLMNRGKVAGILVETITESGRIVALVVGCGINLTTSPNGPEGSAGLDNGCTKEQLLAALLASFDHVLASGDVAGLYRSQCGTIDSLVSVQTRSEELTGTAIDVDEDGALLVRDMGGSLHTLSSGDVVHLRPFRPISG